VAGMKKSNDHAEPTKVERQKKPKNYCCEMIIFQGAFFCGILVHLYEPTNSKVNK